MHKKNERLNMPENLENGKKTIQYGCKHDLNINEILQQFIFFVIIFVNLCLSRATQKQEAADRHRRRTLADPDYM